MTTLRKRLKSLTYLAQFVTILLAVLELNFQLIQDQLGVHYGWTAIVLATVNMYIREVTNKPISEK